MMSDTPTDLAISAARAKAEIEIEKILIELEHDTMQRIDWVSIDTRNFANCDVEIYFRDRP